jgi:diacylglycerol kinase family enzyme
MQEGIREVAGLISDPPATSIECTMARRYLVVGNPTAQSGKARRRIERALAAFRRHGLDATFLSTEPEGRTVEALRARLDAEPFDVVVALGGDGTFAEVAKGMLAAREPPLMGLLPAGTANDQGWSVGLRPIANALDEDLDILAEGHVLHLDVGHIECLGARDEVLAGDLFFDSAGWGLQSDILATRNRDRRAVQRIPLLRDIYRDVAVFAGATVEGLLASLVEPAAFEAEIAADGERLRYEAITDVIVKATPVYAGYWVLDRDAEPDDGRFELVTIAGRRQWFAKTLLDLRLLPLPGRAEPLRLLAGRSDASAARFELSFYRPERGTLTCQIDGEVWVPGDRYRVTVQPGRLPLIVRRDFVPPWR